MSSRGQIGKILRELCRQKDVGLVEGKAMPDHIHLLLSVPPKYSIAMIGYKTPSVYTSTPSDSLSPQK